MGQILICNMQISFFTQKCVKMQTQNKIMHKTTYSMVVIIIVVIVVILVDSLLLWSPLSSIVSQFLLLQIN